MISFSTGKLRGKKSLFWTNEKFVFSFNCPNWERFVEKFVKQIGENIWWIPYKNTKSLFSLLFDSYLGLKFQILSLRTTDFLCFSSGNPCDLFLHSWFTKSLYKNNAPFCCYNSNCFPDYGWKSNGIWNSPERCSARTLYVFR